MFILVLPFKEHHFPTPWAGQTFQANLKLWEPHEEDAGGGVRHWVRRIREDHLESWVNKKAFFEVLISMGLLPADVPADGNCALWSLCALEAGCFIQTKLCTAERIRGVRQDWVISSFNVSYVLLFVATNGYNIVCSEEDIPTSPETHILFFGIKWNPLISFCSSSYWDFFL